MTSAARPTRTIADGAASTRRSTATATCSRASSPTPAGAVSSARPTDQPPVAAFAERQRRRPALRLRRDRLERPRRAGARLRHGTSATARRGRARRPRHAYTAAGARTVTLTVGDNAGGQGTVAHAIQRRRARAPAAAAAAAAAMLTRRPPSRPRPPATEDDRPDANAAAGRRAGGPAAPAGPAVPATAPSSPAAPGAAVGAGGPPRPGGRARYSAPSVSAGSAGILTADRRVAVRCRSADPPLAGGAPARSAPWPTAARGRRLVIASRRWAWARSGPGRAPYRVRLSAATHRRAAPGGPAERGAPPDPAARPARPRACSACTGASPPEPGPPLRRVSRRGPHGPLSWQWMLGVLLTNDDGIEAEGLQALRRALLRVAGDRARRHRAGRQPLGHGALDHHAPAAVGQEVDFGDGTRRLRDRRHAGRLRAAGQPRAGRRLRGRPHRLRHQPRREPRRRHHLLGHRRGGARGLILGLPAIAVSQQSARARDGLPRRRRFDFEAAARVRRAARRGDRRRCRCRRARC